MRFPGKADLAGPAPASLAALNALARDAGLALGDGRALTFVAPPPQRLSAAAYERSVAGRGEIPTRVHARHDVCNAHAWLSFPRTKAALNAIHVGTPAAATPNGRNRARDAATLVDESGMIVACADAALIALWRAHQWRELFWVRRADVGRAMRIAVIGHGLQAKLAAPFRAITAKALIVPLDAAALPALARAAEMALDAAAAARLAELGTGLTPAHLLPLPVAALPGWDTEELGERLFDDASVFRPLASRPFDGTLDEGAQIGERRTCMQR